MTSNKVKAELERVKREMRALKPVSVSGTTFARTTRGTLRRQSVRQSSTTSGETRVVPEWG